MLQLEPSLKLPVKPFLENHLHGTRTPDFGLSQSAGKPRRKRPAATEIKEPTKHPKRPPVSDPPAQPKTPSIKDPPKKRR
jgi:hypothetical protein